MRTPIGVGRADGVAHDEGGEQDDQGDQRPPSPIGRCARLPDSMRPLCFHQGMGDSLSATTVHLPGAGGDEIEAYLARPDGDERARRRRGDPPHARLRPRRPRRSCGGSPSSATTRSARTSTRGEAPGRRARRRGGRRPRPGRRAGRRSSSATSPARPRTCGRCRRRNGKVGVIGYCSGGRQSVLAACRLDLDAAVDCYGAFVTGTPPDGLPAQGDQPRRPAAEPALPAARPVRQRGLLPVARAGRRARADCSASTARPTSSTATTTPATRSSPSTGRPTAWPPPTTAGSGSPPSSPRTSGS